MSMNLSNYFAVGILCVAAGYFGGRYIKPEAWGSAQFVASRGGASLYVTEFEGRRYLYNTRGGLVDVSDGATVRDESNVTPPIIAQQPQTNDSPAPECLSSGGKPAPMPIRTQIVEKPKPSIVEEQAEPLPQIPQVPLFSDSRLVRSVARNSRVTEADIPSLFTQELPLPKP